MTRILISGAGGVPTENVIRSWLAAGDGEEIIGMGSEPSDLILSAAARKYIVPYAVDPAYKAALAKVLAEARPDLAHFQNDVEILEASRLRADIMAAGVKLFMPRHEVVENCVDKGKSAKIWRAAGVRIPQTMDIDTQDDLKKAFSALGDGQGRIWLRARVGGGGKGALPTNDVEFAARWIDRFKGWGKFTAARLLTEKTVTWLSIWHKGELVVAQTRKRKSWNFGNRTLSGVTGVTGVGETCSSGEIDKIAQDAILAIDSRPHGIYGVDMTYDQDDIPNPTEINISRFFTTVFFFTQAGLNMPKIFKDIALYGKFPSLTRKINPLPDGLLWIRSMDREPLLIREDEMFARLVRL